MVDDDGTATAFHINHKYMPVTTPTSIEFETLYTDYNACGEKKLPIIMEPTIGVTTEWTEFVVMAKVLAALDIATKL